MRYSPFAALTLNWNWSSISIACRMLLYPRARSRSRYTHQTSFSVVFLRAINSAQAQNWAVNRKCIERLNGRTQHSTAHNDGSKLDGTNAQIVLAFDRSTDFIHSVIVSTTLSYSLAADLHSWLIRMRCSFCHQPLPSSSSSSYRINYLPFRFDCVFLTCEQASCLSNDSAEMARLWFVRTMCFYTCTLTADDHRNISFRL